MNFDNVRSIEDFMRELVNASEIKSTSPQRFLLESDIEVNFSKQKEVPIDDKTLKIIFKDQMDVYTQAVQSGRDNATSQFLGALEGDVPLQRWRSDLAMEYMSLRKTTNGEFKGILPTKIPEVSVEYNYINQLRSMPQLAIIVNPL